MSTKPTKPAKPLAPLTDDERAYIRATAERIRTVAPFQAWRRAVVILDRQTPHPPSHEITE